jgi:hypothetical protein
VKVVQVAGPRGVGTSSVAWALFAGIVRDGLPTAYVDVAQLGFHGGGAVVTARNLAAVRRNHAAAGARLLVVAGWLGVPAPAATLCWLEAGREVLVARLLARGRGEGPPTPGDDLRGRPVAWLRALARPVPPPATAHLVLATDGLGVEDAARELRARLAARSSGG